MKSDAVLVSKQGGVGVMTFNRPELLHRLDMSMMLAMEQALTTLEADAEVRVILITGSGERAFCAGGDIDDLKTRTGLTHYREFGETVQRLFMRFENCDKPTIAAVNGLALGGGTEMLLAIDIRVLADHVKLGLPEINLGLFPGAGGSQRLMRQIPLCRAKELMFIGDQIDAQQAFELGLCNRVVPRAHLFEEAMNMAQRIAEKSPLVLKLLKRSMRQGAEMPLGAALAHEQALIGLVFDTQDSKEGCGAFIEKRKPDFKGE